MKTIKSMIAIAFAAVAIQSCQKDEKSAVLAEEQAEKKNEVSASIVDKLSSMNVNTKDIKKVDFLLPDGSTEKMYQMEGDINLSEDQVLDMYTKKANAKNYHTYNLVRQGYVIDIMGWTGGSNALSQKEIQGLKWAVENYNLLNLSIRFRLSFGTYHQNKDIVVYHNPNKRSPGGQAGFPSNGRPHKWIQIHGMWNYHVNVVEHLIAHEIGHTVGLRHVDWYSRQSCGQNSREGTNIGVNPIPGTPRGFDSTSVMRACFRNYESGEFNRNDITALNYLYGTRR